MWAIISLADLNGPAVRPFFKSASDSAKRASMRRRCAGVYSSIGVWKFGAVDNQLRREHNPAAMNGCLHQIAVGDTNGGAQPACQGHLAFAMDSNEGGHKVRKSETQTPDGRVAEIAIDVKKLRSAVCNP